MSGTQTAFAPTDRQPLDPQQFAAIADALRRRAGLVFPATRHKGLESAIQRVMKGAAVPDLGAMIELIDEAGPVFDDLVAEITVGESYFFREPAQFEVIRNLIVPELRAQWPRRRIRVWSAAASTGEEAYSLAITLRELGVEGEVIATDISRPRLRAARRGSFRQWSFRGVPQPTIDRWFTRDGEGFKLDPEVRASVDFRYLNLAQDHYPSMSAGVWGMDLILCRNVLIYFDVATIAHVAARLLDSLSEDGWLLLGASDPAIAEMVAADTVQTPAGIAYRRARAGRSSVRITPPGRQAVFVPPSAVVPPSADQAEPELPVPYSFEGPTTSPAPTENETIESAYAAHNYSDVVRLAGLTTTPTTVDDQILLIRALANLGQLEQAGLVCGAALDKYRDVAELHCLHSILLMENGQPADAAAAARRALYLDRGLVIAHLALATASSRAGDAAAAKRATSAAERLLAQMPPAAIVPGSDGEPAGRLLAMTRTQQLLFGRSTA